MTARRVRWAGWLILALGWGAAAIVYATASSADATDAAGLARSETFSLQRMGGVALARTVGLDQWLASLWHGERLAWTLAVLATVVGGACVYIAGLMEETVEPGERGP